MPKNSATTGQAEQRVSYNDVAKTYEHRYQLGPHGITEILRSLLNHKGAQTVLEVGCGTGHWLPLVKKSAKNIYGLDFSAGMLAQARKKHEFFSLVQGDACDLPFRSKFFNFVYCVHAVQHFFSVEKFIREAYRVLRPGGVLAIIGMDPHLNRDRWYIYDYFNDTDLRDRARYPDTQKVLGMMNGNGFCGCRRTFTAGLDYDFCGEQVFLDPILHRNGTSQLSLLTDDEFATGIAKIKKAIRLAAKNGNEIVFPVHIVLPAVYGFAGPKKNSKSFTQVLNPG